MSLAPKIFATTGILGAGGIFYVYHKFKLEYHPSELLEVQLFLNRQVSLTSLAKFANGEAKTYRIRSPKAEKFDEDQIFVYGGGNEDVSLWTLFQKGFDASFRRKVRSDQCSVLLDELDTKKYDKDIKELQTTASTSGFMTKYNPWNLIDKFRPIPKAVVALSAGFLLSNRELIYPDGKDIFPNEEWGNGQRIPCKFETTHNGSPVAIEGTIDVWTHPKGEEVLIVSFKSNDKEDLKLKYEALTALLVKNGAVDETQVNPLNLFSQDIGRGYRKIQ